jgi:tetratricopeptide (TPR) repeat protein
MFYCKRGVSVLAACAVLLTATHLKAIYVRAEIQRVPVDRLIANLERKLAEDPQNIQNHINLGRLHGMAFALKSEELPATKRDGRDEEPWYGYDPKLIPYRHVPAPSAETEQAAKDHLNKALRHYEDALKLNPDSLLARLGYGWLLDRGGEKQKAIEQYRRVIAQAWPTEKEKRMLPLGGRFFTQEAIEYLLPLLDSNVDAAEIQDLRAKLEVVGRVIRPVTPIAVPLRDNVGPAGVYDTTARVRFDADGSGKQREWSWIGPDAGWLVHDSDGNGTIASALQLFGSVTFWLFWDNGYQALSSLDDDGNGEISGTEMNGLAIWWDADRDGVSNPSEVESLEAHGIVALSCRYRPGDGVRFAAVSDEGVRLINGRTRPTYDVILDSPPRILTTNRPDLRLEYR